MKKKFAILLVSCLCLSICGCGSKAAKEDSSATDPVEVTVSVDLSVSESESSVSEAESSVSEEEEVVEETPEVPEIEVREAKPFISDSVSFVDNLKMGWNLGNTFDATGSADMSSETSWGQPKTTRELISYIKEAGFTTIRIPVSWGKHTSGDNYDIDPEWMARVKEVVEWALEDGLYVIINSHHDNHYYYPSDEKIEKSLHYLECIWNQIAEEFKDYDEKLIFEDMNEPRLQDTAKEWYFPAGDAEGTASILCIMRLNQKFVDVVRATGGNNATRYLMVTSHAANPDNVLCSTFEMPEDEAGHLLLSVHAYTPYDFAMNKSGYDEWTAAKSMSEFGFMKRLYIKFVKNGYGVVIGEMGATNKNNLESRIAWAKGYTKEADNNRMACIVWDNGGTGIGEENFGLIDRRNLKSFFPDLLEAYLQNYRYVTE